MYLQQADYLTDDNSKLVLLFSLGKVIILINWEQSNSAKGALWFKLFWTGCLVSNIYKHLDCIVCNEGHSSRETEKERVVNFIYKNSSVKSSGFLMLGRTAAVVDWIRRSILRRLIVSLAKNYSGIWGTCLYDESVGWRYVTLYRQ